MIYKILLALCTIFPLWGKANAMNKNLQPLAELITADGRKIPLLPTSDWKITLDGAPQPSRPHQDESLFIDVDCRQIHTAILEISFIAPEDGTLAMGCGADWYFQLDLDGKEIYSTMGSGNGNSEVARYNHTVNTALAKGKHTFKITLQNGMGAMGFICGAQQPKPVRSTRVVPYEEVEAAVKTCYALAFDDLSSQRKAALKSLQDALDGVTAGEYVKHLEEGTSTTAAMKWYDQALEKVKQEVQAEKVTGKQVVIWLVYNMGFIVKTATTTFSIDLAHRNGPELEPWLDFALITHNHGDHFTNKFVQAMQKKGFMKGKPVVTGFLPTYHFTKHPKTWKFNDITVQTGEIDHNDFLPYFITSYRITCGEGKDSCVIYHVGDSANSNQLDTTPGVDIMMVHPFPFGRIRFARESAAKVKPKNLIIAHLQELGHGFGPGRWTYQQAMEEMEKIPDTTKAGFMIWGQKFIWNPEK